jgi:soluble cytochrome b562
MPTYEIEGKRVRTEVPLSDAEIDEIGASIKGTAAPTAAPAPQPRSMGQELGRQVGLTGRILAEGVSAPVNAVADFLSGAYNVGANLLGSESRMPSMSQAQSQALTKLGVPVPETGLERAVQAGGQAMVGTGSQAAIAKNLGQAAAPLTRNLSQQVPVSGVAGMASQATAEKTKAETDSDLGATVMGILAGTIAGGVTGKVVAGAEKMGAKPSPVLTIDDVKQRAQRSYTAMEDQSVYVKPKSVLDMLNTTEETLVKNNFNPKMDSHKPVAQLLEQLRDMTGTQRVSFTKLEQMRSAATDLKNATDPATRKFAGQVVTKIDDYLSTLGAGDVIAAKGDVGKAVESVQNARKDWRNLSRASILEDALNIAEAKAIDPKASEGELIRRQLINLAADKDKMKAFSTREQNAIKSVAAGGTTDPLLSLVARFNPQRSQITAGALGAGAIANPVAAGGTAAAGFTADKLQSLLRRKQTEGLISNLLTGNTPEPAANVTWRGLLSSIPKEQQ